MAPADRVGPTGTITSITEDERGLLVEARLGKHTSIDFIPGSPETEAIDLGCRSGPSSSVSGATVTAIQVPADEVDELLWTDDPGTLPLMRTITEAKL